jgi:hypothetical protein
MAGKNRTGSAGGVKQHGPAVYFDTSSRDTAGKKRHNCYRADITVNNRRYRRRGGNRGELDKWLETMKEAGSRDKKRSERAHP